MFNTESTASGRPRLPPTEAMLYCKHIRGIKLCVLPLVSVRMHVGRSIILPINPGVSRRIKWSGRGPMLRGRESKKRGGVQGENEGQRDKVKSEEEKLRQRQEDKSRRQRDTEDREHSEERGRL